MQKMVKYLLGNDKTHSFIAKILLDIAPMKTLPKKMCENIARTNMETGRKHRNGTNVGNKIALPIRTQI